MISIPRPQLRIFRSLVRRALLHKARYLPEPCWAIIADARGCRLQAASGEIAVEQQIAGEFVAESYLLPLSALDAWEGRGTDTIRLEPQGKHSVLVTWSDRGVPRQTQFQVGADAKVEFPEPPATVTANDPCLWGALREAVATTDRSATRYALNCLQLRGKPGRLDATDGRHILSQDEFQFGFEEDLLVPANSILGCRELDRAETVAVGRSGDWISFGVGQSLVLLKVQQEGRFPRIDDLLLSPEQATSRLELSAHDAAFLADVIQRLPSNDPQHAPLTLDLNGKVLIRSRDAENPRPTEVELTTSRLSGEPVVFNTDRRYVERALRLGFREAFIYGPTSPVLCRDHRRQFLWALLAADSTIPRSDDALRIESSQKAISQPASSQPTVSQPTSSKPPSSKQSEPTMSVPSPSSIASPEPAKPVQRLKPSRPATSGGPIEQAIALRDALRHTTSVAHQLVKVLKQRQRQSRIVESTLASLKQLQKVAG